MTSEQVLRLVKIKAEPETIKPEKIKFVSEGADKYYRFGNYEFFATRQGREGYTLSASMWYFVPDKYLLNNCFSMTLQLDYAPPTSLDNIRTRIAQIIANNPAF